MVPRDSSWDNLVNELDEHCHDDEVSAAEWYLDAALEEDWGGSEELQIHMRVMCDDFS